MLADVAFETVDGIPVAHVTGDVDMSNAMDLTGSLQQVVGRDASGLVLNLTETNYLDSAGLHFLFDLAKTLRDRGQRLQLVVPDGSPLEALMNIVQMEALAPVSPTLGEALAEVNAFQKGSDPGQLPGVA